MVIKDFSKSLVWFLDLLIYDGHITAISAAFVFSLPLVIFNLPIPFIVGIVPFIACEIIYSFNRYRDKFQDDSMNSSRGLLKKKKVFVPFFLFLFLFLLGYLAWFQHLLLFLFSFAITIMGIFYSLSVKDLTKLIPGIKNFFVSFCWASITILPFTFYNNLFSNFLRALTVFLFVFLTVFLFEIFLDFRDTKEDIKRKLITFPVVLRKRNLVFLLLFVNLFSTLPIFAGIYFSILPISSLILLFSFVYNMIFIAIVNDKIKIEKKIFEFLVDLAKILWVAEIIFISKVFLWL